MRGNFPVLKEDRMSCCRFTAGSEQVWGQLSKSRCQAISSHIVIPSSLTWFFYAENEKIPDVLLVAESS